MNLIEKRFQTLKIRVKRFPQHLDRQRSQRAALARCLRLLLQFSTTESSTRWPNAG
jgi:ABC-type arginine transport system ATPase subunit